MAKQFGKKIEGQPSGNIIQFRDDSEKEIKIDTTGKPETFGAWVLLGENNPQTESIQDKEKCLERMWFDEETKSLIRVMELTKTGRVLKQIRSVNDDDRLVSVTTMTKPDGTTGGFKVIFSRISE